MKASVNGANQSLGPNGLLLFFIVAVFALMLSKHSTGIHMQHLESMCPIDCQACLSVVSWIAHPVFPVIMMVLLT